jgi:hypothetical protein
MIGLRITEDCHPLREVGETQGELLDGLVGAERDVLVLRPEGLSS